MKVGNLVQLKPARHQLPDEPYVGKVGVVVEQNTPCEFDTGKILKPSEKAVEMWWIQWQGNSDWDIEWEGDLEVLA